MNRREVIDDAVRNVERATTELEEVCRTLDGSTATVAHDDVDTAAACRRAAEHVRDLAAQAATATAKLQVAAGMFKALSFESGVADG